MSLLLYFHLALNIICSWKIDHTWNLHLIWHLHSVHKCALIEYNALQCIFYLFSIYISNSFQCIYFYLFSIYISNSLQCIFLIDRPVNSQGLDQHPASTAIYESFYWPSEPFCHHLHVERFVQVILEGFESLQVFIFLLREFFLQYIGCYRI